MSSPPMQRLPHSAKEATFSLRKKLISQAQDAPVCDSRQGTTNSRGEIKRLDPMFESLLKAYDARDTNKVRDLLSEGLFVNYKEAARDNRSPLLYAAKMNFIEVVNELLDRRADPTQADDNGITPLHVAAGYGNIESLKRLLQEPEVDPNTRDANGRTPLHFATQALGEDEEDNAVDIVQTLLRAGATISVKDEDDRTPVHAAAYAGNTEVLSLLLAEKGASLICERDKLRRTPLHQAVLGARSLLAVRILLHYQPPIESRDSEGRTPLHYVAARPVNNVDKDFDGECLELLLSHGASVHTKDDDGFNALSLALQRTMWWNRNSPRDSILYSVQMLVTRGSAIVDGFDMWRIVETFPSLVMLALNQSIRANTSAKDSPHLKLIFDFSPLTVSPRLLAEKQRNTKTNFTSIDEFPIPPPLLTDSEISMHHYIFWAGHRNILRHPLCSAFLHLKWLKVRKFFIMNIILYFAFVLILTFFIMSLKYRSSENLSRNNSEITNNTLYYSNSTSDKRNIDNYSMILKNVEIGYTIWYTLLFCSIFFIAKELLQICHSLSIYIRNYENYMDILILGLVIFLLCKTKPEFDESQRYASVTVIVLSWSRLMLFLGQFPSCGVYIVMFSTVCKTVLRFLSLYLPLIFAFSLGFYLLLNENTSFERISYSFVATLVMMTGEMDVETHIYENEDLSSKIFPCLLLIIFLLLIYIILSNLLVALAVNDLNSIQQRSELLRLSHQVELMVTVDNFLRSPFIPRILSELFQNILSITTTHTQPVIVIYPNRKYGFTEKLFLKILFVFRCRKILTKIFELFVVKFIPPEHEPSLPQSLLLEATQLSLTEIEIEKRDRLLFSKYQQSGSLRQKRQRQSNVQNYPFLQAKDTVQHKLKSFIARPENQEMDPLVTRTSVKHIGMMQPTPSLKASLRRASMRKEAFNNLKLDIANNDRENLGKEIEELRKQMIMLQSSIHILSSKLTTARPEVDQQRNSFPIGRVKLPVSPLTRSYDAFKRKVREFEQELSESDEDNMSSNL